jgi:hypothetical protein
MLVLGGPLAFCGYGHVDPLHRVCVRNTRQRRFAACQHDHQHDAQHDKQQVRRSIPSISSTSSSSTFHAFANTHLSSFPFFPLLLLFSATLTSTLTADDIAHARAGLGLIYYGHIVVQFTFILTNNFHHTFFHLTHTLSPTFILHFTRNFQLACIQLCTFFLFFFLVFLETLMHACIGWMFCHDTTSHSIDQENMLCVRRTKRKHKHDFTKNVDLSFSLCFFVFFLYFSSFFLSFGVCLSQMSAPFCLSGVISIVVYVITMCHTEMYVSMEVYTANLEVVRTLSLVLNGMIFFIESVFFIAISVDHQRRRD